jgi:hypothetical protein
MNLLFLRSFALGAILVLGLATSACNGGRKASADSAEPRPSRASSPAPPGVSQQDRTKVKDWGIAEEFDFDWQGNGAPAHFKIEQSREEQVSRLTIRIKGQTDFVLDNDDAWDEFKNDFTPEEKFLSKNKNLAPSKYAYALSPSTSGKLRPLVFLVTPQYGSDPGNLFVLALDSSGRPKVILKSTLHITEFRDLDGDGVAEIAGQPCFSQGWGHDFLTYDPFHVYQMQGTPEPELKLSLPLTQEYNLKHYYGWAGPDCSEELAVVLHPPGGGKPVIVKSKEAEKMFGKKK